MAGVDGVPPAETEVGVNVAWAEGGRGREKGPASRVYVEEARHRGPSVELAEPAVEAAVGDDAAPVLAD